MGAGSARLVGALALTAAVAAFAAGGAFTATVDDTVVNTLGAELQSLDATGGAVMLELAGEPSAVTYTKARGLGASEADAGKAGKASKERNEQAQGAVLAGLQSAGIDATPLYQVQSAYNGIAVQAAPGTIDELAALPGVAAVHVIPLVELDNHSSVPLIGALQAWGTYGKTGTGMSIAVIDTGIDYVHRGFGGSGSSADYLAAGSAAANPPATTDNPAGFTIPGIYPSAKVVGGFDFAGDAYNASGTGAALVPKPDPNPMDCNGHGTHVAGTAAGTGVNADGTAYAGPYNGSVNTTAMGIGPGVAPGAKLYGLRVFGCAGSTNLTAAAINWATDPNRDGNPSDHVDVINMSLGSAYGTPDDPSAAASNNAAALGVIVVTSAGNSGDSYYVSGSPGSAVRALATASSLDAAERADAIIVNTPASIAGKYIGSKSQSFSWTGANQERTGNVYYPATNQFGCSPWTGADLANIAGRIVLVDWKIGTDPFPCGSAVRANNATAAGATGIIMADSTTFLDTAIGGNATTPGMYTNVLVGNTLKSQLTAGVVNPALNVTLSGIQVGESIDNARIDALSSFSSRGPTARSTGLKPDITAPGQTIWSPDRLTGFRGRSLNGTSMASPHMAGVMALLKQTHPTWSVEQLKALAMNTAGSDIFGSFNQTGDKYNPGRVGAGRVQVPAALASTSIAYNADGSGSVSVSFGDVEVAGTYTAQRTIRVENHGASAQTYTLGYDARSSIPGVSYSFPGGSSVAVPAGGSATVVVQLNADASQMQNTRDATVAGTQTVAGTTPPNTNPRHWLSEAAGLVTLTPTSGPQLRVPVYVAARPASTTKAAPKFLNVGKRTSAKINIAGEGVNTGAEPLGYVSKVSAFELGITSAPATLGTGVSELARGADLQYAGAVVKGTTAYFGLSTFGDWAAPATDTQFNVQVDRNNDGTADVTAFTTRYTTGPNADPLDVFVVGVGTTAVSFTNIFNSNVNTAPYNNSVLVVPVPLASLALPAGTTSFKYRVVGSSRFWGTIDTTDWATYNVATPGLTFSDGLAGTTMYPAIEGQKIDVGYNDAAFTANGSLGVLLLHHFNTSGNRAEVLEIKKSTENKKNTENKKK
jgi:subtilisin family serine protease